MSYMCEHDVPFNKTIEMSVCVSLFVGGTRNGLSKIAETTQGVMCHIGLEQVDNSIAGMNCVVCLRLQGLCKGTLARVTGASLRDQHTVCVVLSCKLFKYVPIQI